MSNQRQVIVGWTNTGSLNRFEGFVFTKAVKSEYTQPYAPLYSITVVGNTATGSIDTDVTYSRDYSYRAYAYSGSRTSSLCHITALQYVSAPPALLAASQSGDPEAYVSWSFLGEYSMSLYRSIDSGSTWPVTNSLNPLVANYTDTTVASATSYWYKVHEVFGSPGVDSNIAEVYIASMAPPAPPMAPLLLPITSGSAILNWTTQSNDQNSFVIEKSVDGIAYQNFVNITTTTESISNGDFETGNFSGWTKVDQSNSTDVVSADPLYVHSGVYGVSAGPWGGITGSISQVVTTGVDKHYNLSFWLNAQGGGDTFEVYWEGTKVLDLSGSLPVTWTRYTASLTASAPTSLLSFNMLNEPSFFGLDDISMVDVDPVALPSTYTDTTVSESISGNTYWYKVAGINQYGTSSFSNTASITFTQVVPPEAPLFLMVTSGSAILDWSGSTNADYYKIYKSVGAAGPYTYLTSSVPNHHVDHDVTASNIYWYKVTAVKNSAESPASNEAYLVTIPCSANDFNPIVYSGVIGYSSGSTYRNTYGKLFPFTTSVSQSISVYARSKDFDAYLALADANGNVLVENDWDGWNQSGDKAFGNAAFTYNLPSGSYNIEVSSVDNAIGRYIVSISPGPRLECSWSLSLEPGVLYVPSSQYIVVGENGRKLVFWNTNTNTGSITDYAQGIQGAVYSPYQDRVFAWVYYQGPSGQYTMSIDEYSNTGTYLATTEYPRYGGQSQPNVPDFSGYLSYDNVNDRILFARYNYSTRPNVILWSCQTRAVVAAISTSAYQSSIGYWMSCYSNVNNCYYVAQTYNSNTLPGYFMTKIDASTFVASNTAVRANIVVSYISSSNTMMIRNPGGKVGIYDPVTDTLVRTISDLPSEGLFEAAGEGDDCSNVFIAGIDPSNGPDIPAVALLDKNTYLPQNYLVLTSDTIPNDPFTPNGFYGYNLVFCPNNSRIYAGQQTYDGATEGRLVSIKTSRATGNWAHPFTASASDTASCITYVGGFPITSSMPGDWAGRAYPLHITVNAQQASGSLVVSDNAYMLDGTYQHNRHNWFFSLDGQTRLNDYTESYVHTWPGRNAIVCNNKYYMMSDGLDHQGFSGEPITASSMLVFDMSGSLLNTVVLTYGGMDWGTNGKNVYVFEHDGANTYIEVITGSTDTVTSTNAIQNIDWNGFIWSNAQISVTASIGTNDPPGDSYYQGKMLVVDNPGNDPFIYCNNLQTGSAAGCGWGDTLNRVYGYGIYYNYSLNMADGTSPYGGWTGAFTYCPLNGHVYVGSYGGAPDYPPIILETDNNLVVLKTWDLSVYTGSNFYASLDLVYNPKNRTIEAFSWYASRGEILVIDPVANMIVCQKSSMPEIPVGASAGHTLGVNPRNGDIYVPQRFDGDFSALTGSVKIYQI